MLSLLKDETFLNTSLAKLTAEISAATVPDNPETVTLTVVQGAKNLTLSFNSEAEDAVSGGAISAITEAIKL